MRILFVVLICLLVGTSSSSVESWLDSAKKETSVKGGKIWAVLVAGSSQYYNYRHQADVCHLYQLLTRKHGIPREQIIVMMMNDIAYNEENPTPGVIVNALHGQDVYEGIMIDYMQGDVTPKNFLDILMGYQTGHGSMKTLHSGPEDFVFVNFVDHGDTGILGFPNDVLHLEDLNHVFEHMYEQKRYKQMLWYVEACFSGSMFQNLSPDMNITAHTAANAHESSYACVFDNLRGTYLGDCWSLHWLNNTEQIYPRLDLETVEEQYKIVKKKTKMSHAMIYGDLDIIYHEKISTFLGYGNQDLPKETSEFDKQVIRDLSADREASVPTPDVLLDTLRRRRAALHPKLDEQLEAEINHHEATEEKVQKTLREIVLRVAGGSEEMLAVFQRSRQSIYHPACNKEVLSTFYRTCWDMQRHPYITKYTYWISNLCNSYRSEEIVQAIGVSCDTN